MRAIGGGGRDNGGPLGDVVFAAAGRSLPLRSSMVPPDVPSK